MEQQEARRLAANYIIGGVRCDAGDGIHELDALAEIEDENPDGWQAAFDAVYREWANATVTVSWSDGTAFSKESGNE